MYAKIFGPRADAGTPAYMLEQRASHVAAYRGQPETIDSFASLARSPHPVLSGMLGFEEDLVAATAKTIAERFIKEYLLPGVSEWYVPVLLVIHSEPATHRPGRRTAIHFAVIRYNLGLKKAVNWLPGKTALYALQDWAELINRQFALKRPRDRPREIILPRHNWLIKLVEAQVREALIESNDTHDPVQKLEFIVREALLREGIETEPVLRKAEGIRSVSYLADIGTQTLQLGRVLRPVSSLNLPASERFTRRTAPPDFSGKSDAELELIKLDIMERRRRQICRNKGVEEFFRSPPSSLSDHQGSFLSWTQGACAGRQLYNSRGELISDLAPSKPHQAVEF